MASLSDKANYVKLWLEQQTRSIGLVDGNDMPGKCRACSDGHMQRSKLDN
jgi:hypothetical protein